MTIRRKLWTRLQDGKAVYRYTMTNGSGASVTVCSIGAGIVSVLVPDRDGKLADVVLGYSKPESYIGDAPCIGKCPGRFANRIAAGKFTLDGKEYVLPINNGPNHLHGGPEGFQNKVWESRKHKGGVEFRYVSEDGEMGYPGKLVAVVRYVWTEDNELRITFNAKSDARTVVNLTNHAYFNLNGAATSQRTSPHSTMPRAMTHAGCWTTTCPDSCRKPQGSGRTIAAGRLPSIRPSPAYRSIPATGSTAARPERGAASIRTTAESPSNASISPTAPTVPNIPRPCSSRARPSERR